MTSCQTVPPCKISGGFTDVAGISK